jgi:hypothetical protein
MTSDFLSWPPFFGRSADDPALAAALAAAGVTKKPKLQRDRAFVQFDLKGQGLALRFTDEAYLRELEDQDIGEGPLVFSGVLAYLNASVSDHLYRKPLPSGLEADMPRAEVRAKLGAPDRSTDEEDPPILDAWTRNGLEVIATYSGAETLRMLGLQLVGA